MNECIFCKIAAGAVPACKIYEDEAFVAFLDIMPAQKGHTLVMPKKHFENIIETPESVFEGLMAAAKRLAPAVITGSDSSGANIVINNGQSAGQIVKHIHVHIIPRAEGDGVSVHWDHKPYKNKDEMSASMEKIVKCLSLEK